MACGGAGLHGALQCAACLLAAAAEALLREGTKRYGDDRSDTDTHTHTKHTTQAPNLAAAAAIAATAGIATSLPANGLVCLRPAA
eukprot:COSAG02_NODE_1478_length_12404_cov_353.335067_11_plen_85_part_00